MQNRSNIWDIIIDDESNGDTIDDDMPSPAEKRRVQNRPSTDAKRREQNKLNQRNRRKRLRETRMEVNRSHAGHDARVQGQKSDRLNTYSLRKRDVHPARQVGPEDELLIPVMQDKQSQLAEAAQQQSLQLPSLYESITTDPSGEFSRRGSGWTRGRSQGWTGGELDGHRRSGMSSHNSDVLSTNLQVSLPETGVAVPARTASGQDSQSASKSCMIVTSPERARRSLSEHDSGRDIESALESPSSPSTNAPFTPQVHLGLNLGTRSTTTDPSPPTTTIQIRLPSIIENGTPIENAPQDRHSDLLHRESASGNNFHVERDSGRKDSLTEVELLVHRVQAELTALRSERERFNGEKITLQANFNRLSTAYEQVKNDVTSKDAKIKDLEQSKKELSATVAELSKEKCQLEETSLKLQERIRAFRRATLELTNGDE